MTQREDIKIQTIIGTDKYGVEEKNSIVKKIEALNNEEHFKTILKILKKDKINYSKNKNGIMFRFETIPDKTIDKVVDFLNSVKEKKTNTNFKNIEKQLTDKNNVDEEEIHKKMSNYEKSVIRRSNKKIEK